MLWALVSVYYTLDIRLLLLIKASDCKMVYETAVFSLPVGSPFAVCPIKRQSLFLYLFNLSWPCNLL